jgi:hypothetical protein
MAEREFRNSIALLAVSESEMFIFGHEGLNESSFCARLQCRVPFTPTEKTS